MSSSTEQTENVREMFSFLTKQTDAAVQNNVAHATLTTNAWRDAVDMIPKVSTTHATIRRNEEIESHRRDEAAVSADELFEMTTASKSRARQRCRADAAFLRACARQTVGSLETLLLQLGNTAGGIVGRVNGVSTVQRALGQLQEMKLIFDSPTRQGLLKKAVTALQSLNATLSKVGAQEGGQFNTGGNQSAVGSSPAYSSASASSGAPRTQPSSSSSCCV